jgi:restriction system protein
LKLRMADRSIFAVLLRKPWWVSAAIALVWALVAMALLPSNWRVFGAMTAFPFVVIAAMAAWAQRHLPSANRVAQVDAAVRALAWPAFADVLEQTFQRDGHTVRRLQGAADFELTRRGQTLLVCARRWKSARTGVEPLRELQAAREQAGAAALYIGLGEVSAAAATFAASHGIAFWQSAELAQSLHWLSIPGSPTLR